MITLDSTLKTAQDGVEHKPIVRLISTPLAPEIPYVGSQIVGESTKTLSPSVILTSDGRVAIAFYNETDEYVYVGISDTDKSEFSYYKIVKYTYYFKDLDIIELSDGSIGIVTLVYGPYYTTRLSRIIVSLTGTIVSSAEITTLENYKQYENDYISICGFSRNDNTYLITVNRVVGGNWVFRQYNSVDFINWEYTDIIPNTLDNSKKITYPSYFYDSDGVLWLSFTYTHTTLGSEEISDLYMMHSLDNGSTWQDPQKITNYTTYSSRGFHSVVYEPLTRQFNIVFTEENKSILKQHYDSSLPGYDSNWTIGPSGVRNFHIDKINRKLYGVTYTSIIKIDLDSWTIDKIWNSTTTPAIPSYFDSFQPDYIHGDGQYVIYFKGWHFFILDGENDTITFYNLKDDLDPITYPWAAKNVNYSGTVINFPDGIFQVEVNVTNNKIFFGLWSNYVWFPFRDFFSIDLNSVGPTYDAVLLFSLNKNSDYGTTVIAEGGTFRVCQIDYNTDTFVISIQSYFHHESVLFLVSISTGEVYRMIGANEDYTTLFPWYNGCYDYVMDVNDANVVWGLPQYYSGRPTQKGLLKITLGTGPDTTTQIRGGYDWLDYIVPDYATLDDYGFRQIKMLSDGRILISGTLGFDIYNTNTGDWIKFDNTNFPGIFPYDIVSRGIFDIDEANEMVYVLSSNSSIETYTAALVTIVGFSVNGNLQINKYIDVSKDVSNVLTPGTTETFTTGNNESKLHVAYDGVNNEGWIVWQHYIGSSLPYYTLIDKIGSTKDLSSFLSGEINLKFSIDGSPNELTFSLSNGHLFDPSNTNSLIKMFTEKGREVTLEIGEEISEVPYYQNQGSFIISEARVEYGIDKYPVISITAYDKRHLWDIKQILATTEYTGTPENILSSIVNTLGDVDLVDISIPTFTGSYSINAQFLDMSLKEIIEQICDRFGQFPHIDVDDKFVTRAVDITGTVDHIYTDLKAIVNFTPDDSFSDFINKVTITGKEDNEIEVLFEEERVGDKSGTFGWWGYKKDFVIYYSEDKSRRVKNPRLYVLETATSIAFELAGEVEEAITFTDPLDKYCTITIDAPDLTPVLIAAIVGRIAASFIPDDAWVFFTIPVGRIIEGIFMLLIANILGSIGNFQYEIYGRPVGYIRREIQSSSEDFDMQNKIGHVLERVEEGWKCNTVARCKEVADREMNVIKWQRNRVRFEKVTHLQDEIGDLIQIKHPYTNQDLVVFITSLSRKVVIGSGGYFVDEVEGWVRQ